MGEKEFHVIPKKILYKCDDCEDGWLTFIKQTSPGINGKTLFLHTCNKCGKMVKLKKQYPMLKFLEVKGNIVNAN